MECGMVLHSFRKVIKVPSLFLLSDVEEWIVNAPLVSLHTKNTDNAKSEVRFEQLICDL
jgi:hypothetical protein